MRELEFRPPRGGSPLWSDGSPAGALAADEFFDPSVQISFVALGLPPGWLVAAQQVGAFTQDATAEVAAGSADFAASQAVGDFSQSASADVRVDAGASQQISSFTQSAVLDAAFADADLSASQQVGDFGQDAAAENDSPAVAEEPVSPGYASTRGTYRVRVGRKWVEVDPLDPMTLKAALREAEEAAQEAAEGRVVDPQRSAAASVRVEPIKAPSVDYAALRGDAQRIAEQVRAVYAQALQRELIARLMREADERDEDEAVLLLLG